MSKAPPSVESSEAYPPMQDIYYIQGYLYKKSSGKAAAKSTTASSSRATRRTATIRPHVARVAAVRPLEVIPLPLGRWYTVNVEPRNKPARLLIELSHLCTPDIALRIATKMEQNERANSHSVP